MFLIMLHNILQCFCSILFPLSCSAVNADVFVHHMLHWEIENLATNIYADFFCFALRRIGMDGGGGWLEQQ